MSESASHPAEVPRPARRSICGFAVGSLTFLFSWIAGLVGFILPLIVGIQLLLPATSYFNHDGVRHTGTGITLIVLAAVGVLPGVASLLGAMLGATLGCCAGLFCGCWSSTPSIEEGEAGIPPVEHDEAEEKAEKEVV